MNYCGYSETVKDGPTFCWWCGGDLRLPAFTEVKDQIGNVHRVHKNGCADSAIDDSRPVTAQPKEQLDEHLRHTP